MVIANLTTGQSVSFDVADATELNTLERHIIQGHVSALSLHCNGVRTCLPPPKKFKPKPVYGVTALRNATGAVVGELIYTQAGDVRVCLSSTFKSPVVRCDLVKTGLMRFNPDSRVP